MQLVLTEAISPTGQALVHGLRQRDHRVRVVVDAAVLAAAGTSVAALSTALGDPNALTQVFRGADAVVHNAEARVDAAWPRFARAEALQRLRAINIAGTENVIAAARAAGCGQLVYLSSADVTLGHLHRVFWNETQALSVPVVGAYAKAKQLAEELALVASGTDLCITALRPALCWGGGAEQALIVERGGSVERGPSLIAAGRNLLATTHVQRLTEAVHASLMTVAGIPVGARAARRRVYFITDGVAWEARDFLARLCRVLQLPAPRPGPSYPLALLQAVGQDLKRPAKPHTASVLRWGRDSHFDIQRAISELGLSDVGDVEAWMAALFADG
ncbi:MAG: NAD-dependent epimerase/dehydratase family protein [Polyangiales bacterium]